MRAHLQLPESGFWALTLYVIPSRLRCADVTRKSLMTPCRSRVCRTTSTQCSGVLIEERILGP